MTNNGKWTAENIADQSGKIAIVTGSNSGLGFETAKVLASKGATVVMACRSMDKAEKAAQEITIAYPQAKLDIRQLDLADLESVREFAAAFKKQYDRLDILVNNAGIMMIPRSETAQGFEMQFGVNHLGHFALTGLLLDLIEKTPGARVVNVSSGMHLAGKINFDDLNSQRSYNRAAAYGRSKLANLLFTYELQRRFSAKGIDALALAAHPGWTATNLQAHTGLFSSLNPILAQKPEMGALPTLYAATAVGVSGGDYYGPGGLFEMRGYPVKVRSNARSHDQTVAKKLWEVSETMTGVEYLSA